MERSVILLFFVCLISASIFSVHKIAWDSAERRAGDDAVLLANIAEHPDRIGWRLTEMLPLKRVVLWSSEDVVSYPPPNSFTPLQYQFSQDELRRLALLRTGLSTSSWNNFDTTGQELLHCRAEPAVCLVYDRSVLEETLEVRLPLFLSLNAISLWRILLSILCMIFAALAVYARLASRHVAHDFAIIPERMSAKRGSLEVSLSKRDLKLLTLLSSKAGAIATKDELYDAGWGREFMPNSRALDQHIINLRRKLDPDKSRPVLIETVHGVGYRIAN